jgi:hypothetical protein
VRIRRSQGARGSLDGKAAGWTRQGLRTLSATVTGPTLSITSP